MVAVFGLSAIPANAVTTNCPGTSVSSDREFQTNTTLATLCLASGDSVLSGGADDQFVLGNSGWSVVDTDTTSSSTDNGFSVTGIGAKMGTFSFTGAVEGFKYALGLNSETTSRNPDWAVFDLNGMTSGTWSILNFSERLVRANLYKMAIATTTPPTDGTAVIPLPASLPLLLGALAGIGVISRRRRAD